MNLLLVGAALAGGYGVPVDGFPSHAERVLLLWTNAARVDPEGFDAEYKAGYHPCGFDDFLEDEKVAKAPMYLDLALTEAARFHSNDMLTNGCFQHESCDGTDTWSRLGRYYNETSFLGENIAMGTTDARYAVMGMWMCSDGHRANIMTGGFDEMGPGVVENYLTQDFAGGGVLPEGLPPVRIAIDDGGVLYADWGDDSAPAMLQFVVEGVERDAELAWGTKEQGLWRADAADLAEGCHDWYAFWETADGRSGTHPEEGSLRTGNACDTDWTSEQLPRGGLFSDAEGSDLHGKMLEDIELVGCASVPNSWGGGGDPLRNASPSGWMALIGMGAVLLERGRRRRTR